MLQRGRPVALALPLASVCPGARGGRPWHQGSFAALSRFCGRWERAGRTDLSALIQGGRNERRWAEASHNERIVLLALQMRATARAGGNCPLAVPAARSFDPDSLSPLRLAIAAIHGGNAGLECRGGGKGRVRRCRPDVGSAREPVCTLPLVAIWQTTCCASDT